MPLQRTSPQLIFQEPYLPSPDGLAERWRRRTDEQTLSGKVTTGRQTHGPTAAHGF
jgi:hypothetical protein